ncbi:transcription initiation factor TFIID subunit [Actinidia rufa]|uniref:Transcription initiation factor TFIID subunit n=1 Tax=Actinidia rufa TaxID=165716 RepID=A0A7J0H490_9ERIC|nr:transcription initiation factor TFIID subunit [Actinidia rufa]
MAASKSYFARANYRFLSGDAPVTSDSMFELDESDVWNSARSASPEFLKPASNSRVSKKQAAAKRGGAADAGATAASLPVNIPDWSKIRKEEYKDSRRCDGGDSDGDCDDEGDRIPPHEFLAKQLARTRIASFSVHEGIGRTLKGRDLSRVRNAIWEKTGFQD